MPPLPKDPEMLQRRNRQSTHATLPSERAAAKRRKVPELPERFDKDGNLIEWHPLTLAAWNDWWKSPMVGEWLKADVHGLYILADLVDTYWHHPNTLLASEIRQQRQSFGLTPLDRRRLQWEVERVESVTRSKPERKPPQPIDDPRKALSVLK